ncbi:MAG TPA: aspartate--tRNA ligase [Flavobacteriaceae bacterium]|nr:aspartate--tRNA ligase [Flavobacteriaceae bacterium]
MYRTHTNGELRTSDIDNEVTLSGWVQNVRNKGFLVWVDLRDRYGITQLIFDGERSSKELIDKASHLGREFVIQVTGKVIERQSKNPNMPTGDIEILVSELNILNKSKTPPFTIEDKTDGGEELRLKYRYLDIRRNPIREKLIFRHKVAMAVRNYLSKEEFIEVETPYLIKSTPEGARDFVVPSRMNKGQFYALPQSPQTFKQLLMVGGMDKYFQIVRCFRDEDLRADRQPEFTQIDCEMAFVTQEDVLQTFEGLLVHLLAELKDVKIDGAIPRMTYDDAMKKYGNDKPDIRFGMEFGELNEVAQHKEFNVFNEAELVVGIAIPGANSYSRREIDDLIKWVRRPQVGAKGMVYARCDEDGTFRSSVDKFYDQEDLAKWAEVTGAKPGDLICVLSGDKNEVRGQLSALRMEMAERLDLRNPEEFAPLWVIDFPLLEWDEESQRYHAMHHPFTAPKEGQLEMLDTDPADVKANAYDLVLNGNEIGGGSIRIHDREMQDTMFKHLGFTKEEAQKQFGFLLEAFEYGAPPHAGIAFGMDRLTAILGGQETIREYIAFPKNNMGRDLMIDAPATIDQAQLDELNLKVAIKEK